MKRQPNTQRPNSFTFPTYSATASTGDQRIRAGNLAICKGLVEAYRGPYQEQVVPAAGVGWAPPDGRHAESIDPQDALKIPGQVRSAEGRPYDPQLPKRGIFRLRPPDRDCLILQSS